jgi:CDP-diacylglycerol--glycerol-3-phosphate 3-phosphatidyltransferase
MVSYTRARAEGAGYSCKVGLLTRVPRVAILVWGLILGWIRPMIILMVVLSWFTVLQRILHVYKVAQQDA